MSPQGVCAALLLGTALYATQATAIRMLPDGDRCARWSASTVLGVVAAVIVFEALAALGLFRPIPALVVALLGAAATRRLTRVPVADVARRLGEDLVALGRFVVGDVAWLRPFRVALALAALNIVARALILPPLAHDTVTYHGLRAAMWVQNGGQLPLRMPGGWAISRLSPHAGEILGAWAMLPFHDDTLYLLVDVAMWLTWLPALAGLCSELGVAPKLRAPLALYVMTIPGIYYFLPGGYVDVTAHAVLLSSLFFTLRALRGGHAKAAAVLAMAAAMAAIAVKVTALSLPTIAAVAMLAGAYAQPQHRRALLSGAGLGLGIGLVVLAPTLIRNTLELGVPLGPYAIRVFGLELGERTRELRWYFEGGPAGLQLASEAKTLPVLFGLRDVRQPTFGAAALPLVAALPITLVVTARRNRFASLLLSLVVASQLATYFSPGSAFLRSTFAWCNARFFVLLPTIAALLVAGLARGRWATLALAGYMALASGLSLVHYLCFFPSEVELWPLLVYADLGVALTLAGARMAQRFSPRALGTIATVLVGLLLVSATRPLQRLRASMRFDALAMSTVGHRFPVEWTNGARLVDDADRPHRIAIVCGPHKSADRQLLYFHLGSQFQNELVYVSPWEDGTVPVFDRPLPEGRSTDPGTWIKRLRARGADHVAVLAPPWIEAEWIGSRLDVFEIMSGNSVSALFRIRSAAESETRSRAPR